MEESYRSCGVCRLPAAATGQWASGGRFTFQQAAAIRKRGKGCGPWITVVLLGVGHQRMGLFDAPVRDTLAACDP